MPKDKEIVAQLTECRTEEAKKQRRFFQKQGKDFCSRRGKVLVPRTDNKANCVTASISKEHLLMEVKTLAYSKSTREAHIDHRIKVDTEANTLSCGDGCRNQSSANYICEKTSYSIKIRKITPTEAEALMTWPKNWTKWGIDEEGKKVEISATKRYQMCGNGIVSNLPKAILEQGIHSDKKIRIFSTFSGVDGSCLALNKNKFEIVGFSEINKYANDVLRYRYPQVPNLGDITKIKEEDVPDHDLMFISCPCQSFSIAGKRAGLEDTRGTLFYETARILKYKKPKWALFENVKGILNHDNGNTFLSILQVYSEIGYSVDFEVFNARDFGSAQNRERVFMLMERIGDRL